jgi:uncharacterized protein with von Willebrand factor type A (vWA) domain
MDLQQVLDELSEDVLGGFGTDWSLQNLLRRGLPGTLPGLEDLRRRLRQAREQAARRTGLAGPLTEARRRLNEIVELEKAALSAAEGDDARLKETALDLLPESLSKAIDELRRYEFESPEAQTRFDALVDDLRKDILDSHFKNLTGSMRSLTPEQIERVKDMLAELNDMIDARERGDPYDFDGFMSRYGDLFPWNPHDLDELLEGLARRAAAMSRMLAAMTPEQRRELQELAEGLMGDMDLAFQMDRLSRSMRSLSPGPQWDEPIEGSDEPMPMSQTLDAIERIGELEELEQQVSGDYAGATLDDIDEERLRRALGEDAVRDLRRLKEIERMLEEAGVMVRRHGKLELTARGARLIGERSLTGIMDRIRRVPTHRARGAGLAEATGQTRPWSFGDEEDISVQRTLYNAVTRSGPRTPVKLEAQDFEIVETETRPRAATALLLDLSFSMPLRGHWVPAKRMALALHALIEGKYPQDSFYLVGFSDYARRMEPPDLATAGWERVHGTNMQHAFLLAQRLLAEDPRPIKQVIMVTDGEPTAHLEDGYAFFNWPPLPETIEKTLREALRLARSGISINVFMLEDAPGLIEFMDRLAGLTGGRVFPTTSSDVGSFVIRDYVGGRAARR